jgi:hypothetical protein
MMRLAVILLLGLAACGGSKQAAKSAPASPKPPADRDASESAPDDFTDAEMPAGADPCEGGE